MIIQQQQTGLITVLSFVIISIAGESLAYPLPTNDVKRIASSVQTVANQAVQIKQEYENNMKIVQEIQNGGYAAAAGDLFGKIQNGDYDRFGDNLKNTQNAIYDGTHSAQKVAERKKLEEAKRLEAEKRALEEEQAARANATANAKTAHQKANKSFFGRAYDWIKGNRLATDAALSSVNAATNGGRLSDVVNAGTRSIGAVVGGNDGAEISSLGGVVSSGIRIGTDAHDGNMNAGEILVRTATDGNLADGVIGAVAAEEGRRNEHQNEVSGTPPQGFTPGTSTEGQDAAILGATPAGQ